MEYVEELQEFLWEFSMRSALYTDPFKGPEEVELTSRMKDKAFQSAPALTMGLSSNPSSVVGDIEQRAARYITNGGRQN